MRKLKTAPIVLAAALQVLPICRVAVVSPAAPSATWAIVSTWVAAAIGLLGSFEAVSGASAGISGLVKYSGTMPVGTPTFEVAEPMGQPFRYRITVSNPGTDFDKNYFNCVPLPPGLTINTNPGAAGYISGTPLVAGTYVVTLVAGNLNYPVPATAHATITIYLPNSPPVFVTQPAGQSVLVGSNATFQTEVSGTPPFWFQWRRDGTNLSGATASALAITNAQHVDAGGYLLVVSNTFGSVTSSIAQLTIREPFIVQLELGSARLTNGMFQAQVVGPVRTNYVVWRSSDLRSWTPLATNWVEDGLLRFIDPFAASEVPRFYRASTAP